MVLAEFHKALGHETRVRIVYLLLRLGELCVCDVEAILGTTQSTTSRHLNHLKRAGIVRDRRHGTWAHYRLVAGRGSPLHGATRAIGRALDEDPTAQADLRRGRRCVGAECRPSVGTAAVDNATA